MPKLFLPSKYALGVFFIHICLIHIGIAKTTPHACYALLNTQRVAQHDYSTHAHIRAGAREAVNDFIEKNRDPDFTLFDDLEDYYLERIAIHGSHEGDILSAAAVNARLKGLLKDEDIAHYDLSDEGGASLIKINGHAKALEFLNTLEKAMNEFPFEDVLRQSHKTYLEKILQKWTALYSGLFVAGISLFTPYIDVWTLPFIGIGISAYFFEAIQKIKNHKSAGESLQAGAYFKSFIKSFQSFSESKTKAWLSFHADLSVSKKFLEFAANGKMNEEVFRDEIYRQASLSNAQVALRSWENDQGAAISIKLDLLLTKNNNEEISFIIGVRTQENDLPIEGGRRARTPTPEATDTSLIEPLLATP